MELKENNIQRSYYLMMKMQIMDLPIVVYNVVCTQSEMETMVKDFQQIINSDGSGAYVFALTNLPPQYYQLTDGVGIYDYIDNTEKAIKYD